MTKAEVQTLLTESRCVECLSSKTLLAVIVNLLITYTGGGTNNSRVTDDGGTRVTDDGGIRVVDV